MKKWFSSPALRFLVFLVILVMGPCSTFVWGYTYEPFAIISDTHIGAPNRVYSSVISKMKAGGIYRIIHTGDAIDTPGSVAQWNRFLELTGPDITLHLAPGNHDISGRKSLAVYLHFFPKTYYSFIQGDTLFILLNTEFPGQEGRITGDQLLWLKTELEKPFRYKFIFLHEPLYPLIPHHGLDKYGDARDELHRLFVERKVSLVVAGHDHMYYRIAKDGITYIVTATLGGWLPSSLKNGGNFRYIMVNRKNGDYSFNVLDVEGVMRDQFSITP